MGTIIDVVTDNKRYYECPVCEEKVWAYGVFAGTQCWGCTGKNPLKGIFDIACHTADMGTAGLTSTTKDILTNNQIPYRCNKCNERKWAYGSYVGNTCWDCMLTKHPMDLLSTGLKVGSQLSFLGDAMSSLSNLKLNDTNIGADEFIPDLHKYKPTIKLDLDDCKYDTTSILSTPSKYSSFGTVKEYDSVFFNFDLQPQTSLFSDKSLMSNMGLNSKSNPLWNISSSSKSPFDLKLDKYSLNSSAFDYCSAPKPAWRYSQSTGALFYGDDVVGMGYSGKLDWNKPWQIGLNDPSKESIRNVGPIPKGEYIIGSNYNSKTCGPITLNLDPEGHNALGRSAFRIHGDKTPWLKSRSEGCIILDPLLRKKIAKDECKKLIVIE